MSYRDVLDIVGALGAVAAIISSGIAIVDTRRKYQPEKDSEKKSIQLDKRSKNKKIKKKSHKGADIASPAKSEPLTTSLSRTKAKNSITPSIAIALVSTFIAFGSFGFSVYSYRADNKENQLKFVAVNKILEEINASIQRLVNKGEITSLATPLSDRPQGGQPLPGASLRVSQAPDAGLHFMVTGMLDELPKGRHWWLGTLSGKLLWPQLRVPALTPGGQELRYRLGTPQGVQSGEVVLIEAGPEANARMEQTRSDPLSNAPLYVPHLPASRIISLYRF